MWSFTTEAFEFPTLRLISEDDGGSPLKPRVSSSSSRCGGNGRARDGSTGGSNKTSSPGTVCTRGGVQDSFSSSDQSSYHGSLDDLEADFDEVSTERMESLVSSLLQDEGQEYQDSCPVLPSKLARVRRSSSSPSVEAAQRNKELQMQYEDRFDNSGVLGSRSVQSFHPYPLDSTKVSVGFPSTDMVFPHEETHHKILKEHESALRASVLGSPAGILDDDGNLLYLSGSQQNGSGHMNPQMMCEIQQQMTRKILRDIEHAYVVQEHLEAIEACRREYATELQVVESMEIMRASGLHLDHAADGGQVNGRENLRKKGNLVYDLRMIANSIKQNSLVNKSAAEQKNEALVGFWNLVYRQGCPTSDTELERVKNDIREVNRVKSHAVNLDSLHSYPAAGHLWPQRTLGTGFSCSLPKIINNDTVRPASAKSCNASGGGSLSAISVLPVRGRSLYGRSRRLGTPSLNKPDGYRCNFDSPPRRIASPSSNGGHLHTSRDPDNNSPTKIVSRARTGFHLRSPICASPPTKCAENGRAAIFCFSNSIKDCPLSQTALPEQKSSKYLAEFAGEEAGRIHGNSAPLPNSPATKALIAQGARSISVLLKPETAAPRPSCSYPTSSRRNGSALSSTGSGSAISHRQLKVSDADALQLIPIQHPSVELDVCNQGQFKTELCNNWQATQYCPYGDHCRFAHGVEELRCVLRHPRYKTMPCRMIMQEIVTISAELEDYKCGHYPTTRCADMGFPCHAERFW